MIPGFGGPTCWCFGWSEEEITFDAGGMRRELPYIPDDGRPTRFTDTLAPASDSERAATAAAFVTEQENISPNRILPDPHLGDAIRRPRRDLVGDPTKHHAAAKCLRVEL